MKECHTILRSFADDVIMDFKGQSLQVNNVYFKMKEYIYIL